MSKVNINGIELELDLMDADVMEKYEELNTDIMERIADNSNYEGKSTAEAMRFQCRCVDEFFDRLFGDGTAEKLFGGRNHLGERMDAFGQVSKIGEGLHDEMSKITQKYGVGRIQNREQRRYQNNHGGGNANYNGRGRR